MKEMEVRRWKAVGTQKRPFRVPVGSVEPKNREEQNWGGM